MQVKKTLIIIAEVLFSFALTSASHAAEQNVEIAHPTDRSVVKETIKTAPGMTKEEIKIGEPESDTDESDIEGEEEQEEQE